MCNIKINLLFAKEYATFHWLQRLGNITIFQSSKKTCSFYDTPLVVSIGIIDINLWSKLKHIIAEKQILYRAEPSTKFYQVPSTEYLRPFLPSTEYQYQVFDKM